MSTRRFCILCGALAVMLSWLVLGNASSIQAQEKQKPLSFINDVAPILKDNCFACHDSKKRSGKYDMTSFEKMLAGGASGDTITAGKSAESEFYDLIVTNEERRMPPRKDALAAVPKEQAAIIKRWIDEGAKLDAGIDPKSDLVRELRIRWKSPAPPAKYPFPTIVNSLALTPDGKQIVVGGHHELTVWNLDGKLAKRIQTRAERAYAMLFLPDGKLVVAGGRPGQEGDVRIFDIQAAGKDQSGVQVLDGVNDPKVMLKQLVDVDDSVLTLALSADGKKLASGGCDRTIRIWDISKGLNEAKLEQSIENHADWVLSLAFAPDGKHLLSSGRDKTAKVWDLVAKESIITFPEHQTPVYGVAVSADSKVGFSVGADKQVRSWNAVGEAKQIKVLGNHAEEILKLASNPKQPMIATASADKTVKLWDLTKNSNLRNLAGLTDYVFAVNFSADGTLIAAGSYDGEVRIWKVADGMQVAAFNASPGYVAAKK
jgi:hypothetical protein